MLNYNLVNELYEQLSKEQQRELVGLLFKRSKQSMGYFKRTKDISLSKLEILADFFQVPLDYFRLEKRPMRGGIFAKVMSGSNVPDPELANHKIEMLQKEIDSLKSTIKAKDEIIQVKTELIESQRQQIILMKQ